MLLSDVLKTDYIKIPMAASDKTTAITELVDLLNEHGLISDYDAVLDAVMQREAARSTGIGQGLAVPHGKSAAVDRLIMAVGKLPQPIDFDSIDGQPVVMIMLLVSPINKTGPHIQALAGISRLMTDNELRKEVWAADSPDQLFKIIRQHDTLHPAP